MEYFDVLDKNRKSLNYKKERGTTLLDNEYNQGAELWIINDKKLLITRRSMQKSHPGMWEVPGGCSQAKETSIDTIIREAKEEVNLLVNENDLCLLGTELYKKQFVDIFKTNKKINIKNIKLQEEEVDGIKFVTKQEFNEMKKKDEIVPSVYNRYEIIKNIIDKDW